MSSSSSSPLSSSPSSSPFDDAPVVSGVLAVAGVRLALGEGRTRGRAARRRGGAGPALMPAPRGDALDGGALRAESDDAAAVAQAVRALLITAPSKAGSRDTHRATDPHPLGHAVAGGSSRQGSSRQGAAPRAASTLGCIDQVGAWELGCIDQVGAWELSHRTDEEYQAVRERRQAALDARRREEEEDARIAALGAWFEEQRWEQQERSLRRGKENRRRMERAASWEDW
jgi:hypothetical protein